MPQSDEVERRFLESVRHPVAIAAFTLLLMVGGGWVGDIAKGDCLNLGGSRTCLEKSTDWLGLLASTIMFAVGAGGLVVASRAYLPVRQLRAQSLGRGRKAIIATVSTFTKDVVISEDGGHVAKSGAERVAISGNIRRDIENLEPLKCNTQQFLRAVAPHIEAGVRHIVLLGSHGEMGSARLRSLYAALLRRYTPDAAIDIDSPPVDMENLDEMQNLITQICMRLKKQNLVDADIMIDVTSGYKTASIAAALATLHQPGLQFQYVRTELPYEIVAFDVITQAPPRLN